MGKIEKLHFSIDILHNMYYNVLHKEVSYYG
mgnify:FL=1